MPFLLRTTLAPQWSLFALCYTE